ncbi:MAG: hypothetical protein R3F20_17440 [Planctomycetota bacterium]
MVPRERSLVTRHEGRPFVLLGVNSDPDRAALRKSIAEQKINWRSFFDGGIHGPISTAWQIRTWPAVFLIDHRGVIRHRDVRGRALDDAVEVLIQEAEAAAGDSSSSKK